MNANFFVFTRGRTGSTAIIDELGKHPDISTLQELFIQLEKAPRLMDAYRKYGKDFYRHIESQYLFPPFDVWSRQYVKMGKFYFVGFIPYSVGRLIGRYLQLAEQRIVGGERSFGFKVLSNHFDEWPSLCKHLFKRNYRVIYLERTNAVRQVISGMVANQRGAYNRKNFQPDSRSFVLPLDEFGMLVKWELKMVKQEKQRLRERGFDVLEVTYEQFLEDRAAFFERICAFLGVPYVLPGRTEYSVMIQDLRKTIANYDELEERVRAMGMEKFLAS
ncbi:MAG: sulfotransferase [Thermodesulfobacteriota bacterium]